MELFARQNSSQASCVALDYVAVFRTLLTRFFLHFSRGPTGDTTQTYDVNTSPAIYTPDPHVLPPPHPPPIHSHSPADDQERTFSPSIILLPSVPSVPRPSYSASITGTPWSGSPPSLFSRSPSAQSPTTSIDTFTPPLSTSRPQSRRVPTPAFKASLTPIIAHIREARNLPNRPSRPRLRNPPLAVSDRRTARRRRTRVLQSPRNPRPPQSVRSPWPRCSS